MNCKKLIAFAWPFFFLITLPAFAQDILIHGGEAVRPPPAPAELERAYHLTWKKIADLYYAPKALASWGDWEHKYDGKLATTDDLSAALSAMVESLGDRWTTYTSPRDWEEAVGRSVRGQVESGLDLVRQPDGSYRVNSIEYGSPAYKSRLREGDLIEKIDGKQLKGLSTAELRDLLEGVRDSEKVVDYLEGSVHRQARLVMSVTPEAAVEARLIGSVAYARFPEFDSQNRLDEFEAALLKLHREAGGKVSGLVLDLRNNGGGSFHLALRLAALFLNKGIVIDSYTRERNVACHSRFRLEPADPELKGADAKEKRELAEFMRNAPLVLLVNHSAASASELVTGALKDNLRAKVVGTRTYGKGVGYKRYNLPYGGWMTLTELSFTRPNGLPVQDRGIQPNVFCEQPRDGRDAQLELALSKVKEMVAQRTGNH